MQLLSNDFGCSTNIFFTFTVKLGFKELLNKEQTGNSEPFPVSNLPVYLINSEQIGISEQFCDDHSVPECQVWVHDYFFNDSSLALED